MGATEGAAEAGRDSLGALPATLLAGPLLQASRLRARLLLAAPSTDWGLLLRLTALLASKLSRAPASEKLGEPGKLHTVVGVGVAVPWCPSTGCDRPAASMLL